MHPTRNWKHPNICFNRFILSRFFDAYSRNSAFPPASNVMTSEFETRPRAVRLFFIHSVPAVNLKGNLMKLSKLSLAFFGSALLLSSAAVAGDSNKGSLNLYEKVNVEGKELNPGKYSITWEGTGPDVQVTVSQGKQTVATFPAHVTEQAAR